jgi:hypothetical protein
MFCFSFPLWRDSLCTIFQLTITCYISCDVFCILNPQDKVIMFSMIAVYIQPRYSNYVPIKKERALSNEKLFREYECHRVHWICARPGSWTFRTKFIVCALYLVSLPPPTPPHPQRWNEKISGSPDTSVRRVLALRSKKTACQYGGQLRISWQKFTDTPDLLHHLRAGSAERKTPHSTRFDVRNLHRDAD